MNSIPLEPLFERFCSDRRLHVAKLSDERLSDKFARWLGSVAPLVHEHIRQHDVDLFGFLVVENEHVVKQ